MTHAAWSEADLAYFAGIMDGEGSFSLKNHGSHRFPSQVCVGNTDPRLMTWLCETFGGTVSQETKNNVHHKQVWRWYASAKDQDAIVSAVIPYLVLKRDRAELFLAYRQTLHRIGQPRKTSQELRDKRMRIHQELSVLNRRGVA